MSIEPQIRFCASADGTHIAYTVIAGRERPLLFVNFMFLPIQAERIGAGGAATGIVAGRQHVRFDRRGIGYSKGPVIDFSLDAQVADVAAVATQAGFSEFDVMAFADGCLVAAAFAGRYPTLVRRLVLSGPTPPGGAPAWRSLATMVRSSWSLGRGPIADVVLAGEAEPEARRAYIRLLAEAMTEETAASYLETTWDPGKELQSITAPTLVVWPKRRLGGPIEAAQVLAAGISGARFLALDVGELDPLYAAVVREFFGDPDVARTTRPSTYSAVSSAPGGMTAILFTDIADSTALTERVGDAAFREASRALDAGLREAIHDAGGAAIEGKLLGDGVLATFPSAAQAIDGARRCLALSAASELGLHIGLHAGDVICEENNVFGGAVNIAARICALSAPGEILVSDVVRGMARSSAGVEFADRGEQEMKGVGEPVRLYEVRWRE
jgi:class 3 adenylate cyclase